MPPSGAKRVAKHAQKGPECAKMQQGPQKMLPMATLKGAPGSKKTGLYLCSGCSARSSICDTCATDLRHLCSGVCVCEKQHLRHLCSGFGAQSSICDTGAADVVPEADMCLFFFLVTQKSWVVVWWSIKGLSKSRVWLVCGPNWVVAQITWLCGYALLLLSATVRNHVLLGSMPLAVSL